MFRFLPEQASEIAAKVDWIHNWVTDISVFFTIGIVGATIYFAVRYRRRGTVDHDTPQIHGSTLLEMIWTAVPALISVIVAYYGVIIYREMQEIPAGALEVQVSGRQWAWDFQYSNGKKTTGEIVVPVDTPIKLVMTSRDVIHSFFVPEMRVKKDVIPGSYTYISFRPIKSGTYQSYCTEYCGREHYNMLATMRVVPKAEFERWLEDRSAEEMKAAMNPVTLGQALYTQKGCNACHSLDGSRIVGPTFLKLFGSERKFTDGTTRKADENYIQQSIYDPASQVVEGFTPLMVSFQGQIAQNELEAIIAFIKSLDGSKPVAPAADAQKKEAAVDLSKLKPAERGKWVYENKLCKTCHTLDGSRLVGPSFKGLYGHKGKLATGAEYTADDEYIKHSIYDPSAQVVEGYQPSMPPFKGQLTDEDVAGVIEFMKELK